jgi:hypothetical protein
VTPTKITSPSALRPSTLLGFGLAAGAVVGALAANPVQAYQATFNLQVANETSTSRTFTSGGNTDLYTEMTVRSIPSIGSTTFGQVTTDNTTGVGPNNNGYGLCVITTICSGSPQAATFSFSKPIQNFRFTVGRNVTPAGGWGDNSFLRLTDGASSTQIALSGLVAGTTYSFPQSILVAAGNSITVGFACTSNCPSLGSEEFYISDVIVEAPAPLPLIGTGAAFAWTRRLRRRIKTSPVQSARS